MHPLVQGCKITAFIYFLFLIPWKLERRALYIIFSRKPVDTVSILTITFCCFSLLWNTGRSSLCLDLEAKVTFCNLLLFHLFNLIIHSTQVHCAGFFKKISLEISWKKVDSNDCYRSCGRNVLYSRCLVLTRNDTMVSGLPSSPFYRGQNWYLLMVGHLAWVTQLS